MNLYVFPTIHSQNALSRKSPNRSASTTQTLPTHAMLNPTPRFRNTSYRSDAIRTRDWFLQMGESVANPQVMSTMTLLVGITRPAESCDRTRPHAGT